MLGVTTTLLLCALATLGTCQDPYSNQPRLVSRNGHLEIRPAMHRNVTIFTSGSGRVNINQIDLNDLVDRMTFGAWSGNAGDAGGAGGAGPRAADRLQALERAVRRLQGLEAHTSGDDSQAGSIVARIADLEQSLQRLLQQLQMDECTSNPCKNGATCEDRYGTFVCRCPSSWQGTTCTVDVNECVQLSGTDLGCQNGATCSNTAGGFRCECAAGWFGQHCTERSSNCSSSNERQLCGHGTCVSQADGHKCICEQGWRRATGSDSPACTEDVNECLASHPACSHDPPVPCINTPGSFRCGACPAGYVGNGFTCTDVDECLQNNGGCSMNPVVDCYNTRGSRRCGVCPPGYQGNGVVCQLMSAGICSMANGGCHPLARCFHNPAISASHVQCTCPAGYVGIGVGLAGCYQMSGAAGVTCATTTCLHGTCSNSPSGFHCTCAPGYTGVHCDTDVNECLGAPCQNGGTCTNTAGSFTCQCTGDYTGPHCQTQQQACGGVLDSPGALSFPHAGVMYPHRVRCTWRIIAPRSSVLNVTFTRFQLEQSPGQCRFDWLQIHDGESSAAPMLGRYCGTNTPGGGNLVTTHNSLYMTFWSDSTVSDIGFAMNWNLIDPVCGGALNSTYGSISSPGYPGLYPHNRDCVWSVAAPLGKRLTFQFAVLQLEHHANCSYDYLEIRDGYTETTPILYRFCSTGRPPPPFTTSGPYAWLRLHTDNNRADHGFFITYSQIPGIPGCGGELLGEQGIFSTPTHMQMYHHNMDCEWRIRVPNGERVLLRFDHFALEDSTNCIFDGVEVRDGPDADSPLAGTYCGDHAPPPFAATGHQLFVRFFSDVSVTHGGFSASYEVLCGGVFSAESGAFQSPKYPESYPHNKICNYIIRQPPGRVITLQFVDFLIETHSDCSFDSLQVFDGAEASFPSLGKFCYDPPPTMVSTNNYLLVRFITDGSVSNRGFFANYTTIDTGCGGIMEDPLGTISSPTHPDQYPHGAKCSWIIHRPPGQVIRLTWLTFSLEGGSGASGAACYDYVAVFDNSTAAAATNHGRIGRRYCGTTLPPTMTSLGNIMTVRFSSDDTVTHQGFSASYIGLNTSTLCGATYHTVSGVLQSPNFPGWYPASKDCTWIIQAPENRQIMLNVTTFHLESHTNCMFDFLEIRNGGSPTAPLIGKYCGTNIPPTIRSHAHRLFLRFRSDSSRSGAGFRISWDATATGCGGQLTGPAGSIMSPNYPQPYAHRAVCTWVIAGSAGSKVRLSFIDLDLESHASCAMDYIEVYEGFGRTAVLKKKACGSDPLETIETKTNTMTIKFVTDYSLGGRGFFARYHIDCNTTLTGHRGVIESPAFPDPYPHDRDCTWTIKAPMGNALNISFSHFDVEDPSSDGCEYDYLEIKEGKDNEAATVLGSRMCGRNYLPASISTSKNIAYVHFKSDQNVAHNGFRLEWFVHGCGGVLTKRRGTFSSPNSPQPYPPFTQCVWYIRARPGDRISLTVISMDIESSDNCRYDSLKVYGGPDQDSPLLTKLCHAQSTPSTFISQGSRMTVRFASDSLVSGHGFSVRYHFRRGGCGGRITAVRGTIRSPNYPLVYDAHSDCRWLIQVPRHHSVQLTFGDFDVEPHNNCSFDYVAVYDGASSRYPLLLKHCGNSVPDPPTITSTGSSMYIRLKADGSIAAKGFSANYTITNCGGTFIASSGDRISSPHYPMTHAGVLNCTWILRTSQPGSHVYLQLDSMSLHSPLNTDNCSFGYLEVREGAVADGPLLHRLCGSLVPPTITSRGDTLRVQLVAKGSVVVRFNAFFSNVSTACGRDLLSENGLIASPGYPSSYPNDIDCWWRVMASQGSGVRLSFRQFQIAQTDHCNGDYIEVREGSATGRLLGHFCGSEAPLNVSSTGRLLLRFHSNEAGTGSGFLAEFATARHMSLSGSRGIIESPLYPLKYQQASSFSWHITVNQSNYIHISFDLFNTEHVTMDGVCQTYVQIYDGADATAAQLGERLCGWNLPEPVVSSSNEVFIEFVSRPLYTGSRFRFRWHQLSSRPELGTVTSQEGEPCVYTIYLAEGNLTTITTPDFPAGYEAEQSCSWTVTADPHMRVRARVNTIDLANYLGCTMDNLTVYDGHQGTANWKVMTTLCRRSESGTTQTSSGNLLKLGFVSAPFYRRHSEAGFNVSLSTVCGGYLRDPNGVISSPGFPDRHTGRLTCEWIIKVHSGYTIQAVISDLDIAGDSSCPGGYLVIRNGPEIDSPYLGTGRFCGSSTPDLPESSSNKLHVKLVLTGAQPAGKLRLTYRSSSFGCGGQLRLTREQPELVITTPNYPNVPPAFSECTWRVVTPSASAVKVHFVDTFDITSSRRCRQAYVEVRDGGTEMAQRIGRRHCSDTRPGTKTTSGNAAFIRYYTNATEPRMGFKAKVSIASCGGTYYGRRGRITLGGDSYGVNRNCSYLFIGPSGHSMRLWSPMMDLENSENCTKDYVEIRDFNSTGEVLAKLCGRRRGRFVTTSANLAHVSFVADGHRTNNRGFKLSFRASMQGCGGWRRTSSGVLSSPGYPHGVPRRRRCMWRLQVPMGRRIRLQTTDWQLPQGVRFSNGRCRSFILVQDGAFVDGQHSPFLNMSREVRPYCLPETPPVVSSTGNQMTIMFYSHVGSTAARGFQMRYTSDEPALCGGEITTAPGSLASIQYPRPLSSPAECRWHFSLPRTTNSTTLITFNAFLLPTHGDCSLNRMTVTPDELELPTETVCGNRSIPTPLVIPFTDFKLVYMNFAWPWASLFNLTYSVKPCGGLVRGPGAQIFSPGYPSDYPNNMDCAWLLEYEQGQTVRVRFAWHNLGPGDHVTVLNGAGSSAPQLSRLTGVSAEGAPPVVLHGQSNRLLLVFHSDGAGQHSGFQAETESGCGGVFHTLSGAVESPGFPTDYPPSVECEWEVRAPEGYRLRLSFVVAFDLETSTDCTNDFVQVWEKLAEQYRSLGKLCGKQVPSPITSTRRVMKIRFVSNNNSHNGNGFKARWEITCGQDFTENSGTFSSPGYPEAYKNNLDCVYRILAKPNDYVTLRFVDDFLLEDSSGCKYDKLAIFEGNTTSGSARVSHCGDRRPDDLSVRGPVSLLFHTDISFGGHGWRAEYTISPCGGNVTAPSVIQSPAHPLQYHTNANCTWLVTAPEDKVVLLRFVYLDLEQGILCPYDWVAVYDDRWTNPEKQMDKFCGDMSANPPHSVSTSNHAVVQFKSDQSYQGKGFKAVVLFSLGCGGEMTVTGSGSGTFRSPDTSGSGSYDDNLDCRWLIRGDSGRVLRLTLQAPFNIEVNGSSSASCTYDYLEVYDGAGPTSPLIGRYCGSEVPPPTTASSNQLYVRFYSDQEIHRFGFSASITNVETVCGSTSLTVTSEVQVLQTPDHPAHYPAGLNCVWTLAASRYQSVVLHFTAIDIDGGPGCVRDKLTVQRNLQDSRSTYYRRDGTTWYTERGSQDITLCGSTVPADIHSTFGAVRLRFRSDSAAQAAGFRLEYSLDPCNRTYTAPYGMMYCAWENTAGTGTRVCHQLVQAPQGTVVTASVLRLSHGSYGNECDIFNVQLLDGTSSSSPRLSQVCGGSYQTSAVTSTGNNLLVRVQATRTFKFAVSYYVSEVGARCGGSYHGMGLNIFSPGYPGNYSEDGVCEWSLSVPPTYKVGFRFYLELDFGSSTGGCNTTYLAIDSVTPSGARTPLTTYCGQTGRMAPLVGGTNAAVVRYHTDSGTYGNGWMMIMTAVGYRPETEVLHARDELL